jgi:transposase
MKITVYEDELKLENKLCVAVDVGKSSLDCYAPFKKDLFQMVVTDKLENRSNAVRGGLKKFQELAAEHGLDGVSVVCEPTGGCERTLLRVAHELGIDTAYVNGESVSKLRVVRQNDTGKSDELDPVVIHLAATQGKRLQVRHLSAGYAKLRELNVVYDQVCNEASMLKNCIHDALYRIFPDLRLECRQLFSSCGAALVKAFGGDPAMISRLGYQAFSERMKSHVPRLRVSTLKRIFADAQVNSLHFTTTEVRQIQREHLRDAYERWRRLDDRKESIKEQMWQVYRSLPESTTLQLPGVPDFMMARVIGETGPLSDYASHRRLLRMAGLNLRERKSGKYKGKNKISKKGRARLRKTLYQMAMLFLVKPGGIYSKDYTRRKLDGAPTKVAMTAIIRKFVRAIYGIHRSGKPFCLERINHCESQIEKAA